MTELLDEISKLVSESYLKLISYSALHSSQIIRKPALFNMSDYKYNTAGGHIITGSLCWQKIIMWQKFAYLLMPSIYETLYFFNQVPGFSGLYQKDKISCTRLRFFEIWILQAASLINPLDGTITFSDGSFISKQQMEIIFEQEFINDIFNFVCWFNSLHLNDSAISLYCSAVLVSAERGQVLDPETILRLHLDLMKTLKHQLNKDRPDEPHMFEELTSKLHELHILGANMQKHIIEYKPHWNQCIWPSIFAEVFYIRNRVIKLRSQL